MNCKWRILYFIGFNPDPRYMNRSFRTENLYSYLLHFHRVETRRYNMDRSFGTENLYILFLPRIKIRGQYIVLTIFRHHCHPHHCHQSIGTIIFFMDTRNGWEVVRETSPEPSEIYRLIRGTTGIVWLWRLSTKFQIVQVKLDLTSFLILHYRQEGSSRWMKISVII